MKLQYKKLHPDAREPVFATDGAACFDLYAARLVEFTASYSTYSTDLAFAIPEGYHMRVYSRSGHGFKDGITLANSVGIIDSDYRGEVMVKLVSHHRTAHWPAAGTRIAQAMICKNIPTEFECVDELPATERGEGGFGSTGVV